MSVVTSFRYVYFVSRVFGIFPYKLTTLKGFQHRERILNQGRVILGLIIVVRLVVMTLDLKYNIYSTAMRFRTVFRALNTFYLNFLAVILYRNVFKYSKSTCEWLNKMNNLFASMQGNTRHLLTSNRFLVIYSLVFFCGTNVLAMTGFLMNNNFLNGPVAVADGFCFVLLLGLQNLYLCQLLTFMRLISLSFVRINDILDDGSIQRMNGKLLKIKLKKLRARHLVVTDFFYFINSAFELHVLFFVFWSFCSTVFCFISVAIFDLEDSLTLILWASYHPFQNWPLLYLCESVSSQSKKSAHCLHALLIQNDDPDVKEEVEIFSLQLQQRPVDFNVCGFFYLNYGLFLTVLGVVVTYIITFIQIQPTPAAK